MKNIRYKANLILILSTLGFIISYPFHAHFIGGLLSSAFIASMIGGCADWFAISALFRRPLGITFKTEIIFKNRDRIFESLAGMLENELLTKDVISKRLLNYQISDFLIQYFNKDDVKASVHTMSEALIRDFIEHMDSKELVGQLNQLVQGYIPRIEMVSYLADALELCIKNGDDEKGIEFAVAQLVNVLKHPEMNYFLESLISSAKTSYESGNQRRKLSNAVLINAVLRLSDRELAEYAGAQLMKYLEECKVPAHPLRRRIKKWLREKTEQWKSDLKVRQDIESWIINNLFGSDGLGVQLESYIRNALENDQTRSQLISRGVSFFAGLMEQWELDLEENQGKKEQLDMQLKGYMISWVEKNHHLLRKIVMDNLNKLSNDSLVELIESKVGNELQMIRINGSVVGGLAGLLLHLLTFWI